jgi:hypothetical protein
MRIRLGRGSEAPELSVKQAGQIIVVFALMLTSLIGLVGLAIDVTYAWRNGLQVQRAADAAAMAGVVYLPGDLGSGEAKAGVVAAENGYTSGVVSGCAGGDCRKMQVTITTQVPTTFVRLFGINSWTITRTARAAYVLPVPMGSPLSYLGVGCFVLKTGTPPPCNTTGTGQSGITTAGTSGGTSLSSLGAFGAVITKGGNQQNGDAYLPANNGGYSPANNVLYDSSGYFYTVYLPAGGDIKLFDPGFCAMGGNGAGGSYGTGDHWIDGGNTGSSHAVSTYYMLWNTNNTPMIPSSWTHMTALDSGATYANQYGYDAANGSNPGGATSGCPAWHDNWVSFASGLTAGTYELQVTTSNPADSSTNTSTNAENMFAIEATGTGSTVYGYDKMAIYNNLMATGVLQQFYLAKVDAASGAGKTMTIDLFDVGDSTAGYIQILSPDGGSPTIAGFSYATYNYDASGERVSPGNCVNGASDSCTGGPGRTKITVNSGSTSFNNTWIEITIPLPTSYGSTGLWQGGWWQVQYNTTAGNDTTTWSVNVNGNPVHLIP